MRLAVLIVIYMAVSLAVSLLAAQYVVWGLSLFHVDSGIWGPYFILAGLGLTITTAVTVGNSSNSK